MDLNTTNIIIISVLGVALLLAIVLVVYCLKRKPQSNQRSNHQNKLHASHKSLNKSHKSIKVADQSPTASNVQKSFEKLPLDMSKVQSGSQRSKQEQRQDQSNSRNVQNFNVNEGHQRVYSQSQNQLHQLSMNLPSGSKNSTMAQDLYESQKSSKQLIQEQTQNFYQSQGNLNPINVTKPVLITSNIVYKSNNNIQVHSPSPQQSPGFNNQQNNQQKVSQQSQSQNNGNSNHATSSLMTQSLTYGNTTLSPEKMNQPVPLSLPGAILTNLETDLRIVKKLTEGGAGELFIAEILSKNMKTRADQDKTCIVKMIKEDEISPDDMVNSFNHEVAIMWMFHLSRNIIKILGYSENPRSIITRHYQHGSLHDIVHQTSKTDLKFLDSQWTPEIWIKLARDLLNAIKVIHTQFITHNDIKTANILIDFEPDKKTVKAILCDFGIACPVDPAFYGVKMFRRTTVIGASAPYCAPEVFIKLRSEIGVDEDIPEIAKAGDIYSVAVVMYEMMMRRLPWSEVKFEYSKVEEQVLNGFRPKYRQDVIKQWSANDKAQKYIKLMEQMWNQNPMSRPIASEAYEELNRLLK